MNIETNEKKTMNVEVEEKKTLNIKVFFETLAKIIGEREGLEIKFKIERKCDDIESRIAVPDLGETAE